MSRSLAKLAGTLTKLPWFAAFVFDRDIGRDYGIGVVRKARLLQEFRRNVRRVQTLSTVSEHLELAATILRLPRGVPGNVVECGCFQGGSSVNISLVCELVGRRLIICDSFEGLPEPQGEDVFHRVDHRDDFEQYQKGQFASSLETVQDNLRRFGRLDVCDFKIGFFDQSMSTLEGDVAMAFLDVDLIDSIKPCLTAIWPRLGEGCRVYVHDAEDLVLAGVFFDRGWWQEAIGEDAPGLVGAGSGLPLEAPQGSELGYAQRGRTGS